MAAFQWKGSIQFGAFVAIPVRAKAAVTTENLALEMLHDDPQCHGNAGFSQDWACKACGEKLANGRGDTVKGWKGHPVDAEYLASLKAEKSSIIELDGLVPAEQIDPRYYEKSYDVTPEEGGEKAYVLLLRLLERSKRVAIGRAVMQDRETIVTVRPRDGILALEVMYWPEDLARAGRDATAREKIADVAISEAELSIGDQLVAMLSKDFDPTQYSNVYAQRVLSYLRTVEAGEVAPATLKPLAVKGGGMDLLAALNASIAATKANVPELAKTA